MSSERKIAANRQNASHSTGPRTAHGKKRASRNALRHGLTVSILQDSDMLVEVEQLARAIVGVNATPLQFSQAQTIAEAELDIVRIRRIRVATIDQAMTEGIDEAEAILRSLPLLEKIDRYERRALSRRKRAIRKIH